MIENRETFDCFGSQCVVIVSGASERSGTTARAAVRSAREQLLAWHDQFSRFIASSELTRLNENPAWAVPVSPVMARLLTAVVDAGAATGGLVDATQAGELERAGYRQSLQGGLPLPIALGLAPARRPALPAARPRWAEMLVDPAAGTVSRPPGIRVDSGGLAKGLFADILAERLAGHGAFVVGCGGDLALGGEAGVARTVNVESPFDGSVLHTLELDRGAVATSGIGRRSWLDANGAPAHHLLNPATGEPAFTGVVQVSALAPSALLAETRAKAALLSGPGRAERWLPDGGVIVFDDGTHHVVGGAARAAANDLAAVV
jgi:thiamine biosynthesis lipoprotein